MKTFAKSTLLGLGLAFLMTAGVHAKDEPKASAKASASAPAAASASASTSASAKAAAPMDINTASKKELASLPKIGDVRSQAIIKGRPYKSKDELVSKKILTDDIYQEIKELIIAKQKK